MERGKGREEEEKGVEKGKGRRGRRRGVRMSGQEEGRGKTKMNAHNTIYLLGRYTHMNNTQHIYIYVHTTNTHTHTSMH